MMNDKQLRDYVLQSGLVLGMIIGVATIIKYLLGIEIFTSWWGRLLTILLAIGGPIYHGVKWKQFKEGYLDFRHSFLVIFSVFAVSMFVSTMIDYTLYNFIDTDLAELVVEEDLKASVALMEKVGSPEAEIDKLIKQTKDRPKDYGIVAHLQAYLVLLVIGAVIGLIGGAIIKKNAPVFDEE